MGQDHRYRDHFSLLSLAGSMPGPVEVVERYAEGRVPIRIPASGYGFTWGQVVERWPSAALLAFDLYLEALSDVLASRGLGVTAMQERVFAALEIATYCAIRDNALSVDVLGQRNWSILPAPLGRGAAFTVAVKTAAENQARDWLSGEFLTDTLPLVEQAVIDGIEG
jgi:hypothetical protein